MDVASNSDAGFSLRLARKLVSDLAAFAVSATMGSPSDRADRLPAAEATPLVKEYDRRIVDKDLRLATRSRFGSAHYADAVEAGVKVLNEVVRARTGSTLDGDGLMTWAFSEKSPKLRLNRLRSDSDRSQQRGHMMGCQAVVAAWRNPRAHSSNVADSPAEALMMLEHLAHLISVTKAATRARTRQP